MNCPFCGTILTELEHNAIMLFCEDTKCQINSDMARYTVVYSKHGQMTEEVFYLEPYYIQTSFANNYSIVSILEVIVLFDSVLIPRAVKLDFNDINGTLDKIKVLLTFS